MKLAIALPFLFSTLAAQAPLDERGKSGVVEFFVVDSNGVPVKGDITFSVRQLRDACLQGEGALVINPQIFEIKYCREAGGGLSMRTVLQLTVRNPGTTSIILARFTRLSAFSLFADQKDIELNRPETGEISSPWRMFDASKLNKAEPAPELFEVIKPHASCELGMQEIRIPLKPGRPDLRLMGKDHYLRLAFNPWPESRQSGEELRRAWASYGRLQIESLVSLPIKLHIDADPAAKACIERID